MKWKLTCMLHLKWSGISFILLISVCCCRHVNIFFACMRAWTDAWKMQSRGNPFFNSLVKAWLLFIICRSPHQHVTAHWALGVSAGGNRWFDSVVPHYLQIQLCIPAISSNMSHLVEDDLCVFVCMTLWVQSNRNFSKPEVFIKAPCLTIQRRILHFLSFNILQIYFIFLLFSSENITLMGHCVFTLIHYLLFPSYTIFLASSRRLSSLLFHNLKISVPSSWV